MQYFLFFFRKLFSAHTTQNRKMVAPAVGLLYLLCILPVFIQTKQQLLAKRKHLPLCVFKPCLLVFVFFKCIWQKHACQFLRTAPKHSLCHKHPQIHGSQVNVFLSIPPCQLACVGDVCQVCEFAFFLCVFGMRDLTSFASVHVYKSMVCMTTHMCIASFFFFLNASRLIHVFIRNDPVLRGMETMTYLPHRVKGREREEERGNDGSNWEGWGAVVEWERRTLGRLRRMCRPMPKAEEVKIWTIYDMNKKYCSLNGDGEVWGGGGLTGFDCVCLS